MIGLRNGKSRIEIYKSMYIFHLFSSSITQENRTCNHFCSNFILFFQCKIVQFGIVSIVEISDFVNTNNSEPFQNGFFIDFSGFCCILNIDVYCCLKRQIRIILFRRKNYEEDHHREGKTFSSRRTKIFLPLLKKSILLR